MTTTPEEIPARIQRATSELIELEHALKVSKPELDSRVLYEFRQAVAQHPPHGQSGAGMDQSGKAIR